MKLVESEGEGGRVRFDLSDRGSFIRFNLSDETSNPII